MADFKKGDKFKIKDIGTDHDYWYDSGEVYTFDHYVNEDEWHPYRGIVTEELIAEGHTEDDAWIGEDDVEPLEEFSVGEIKVDISDLLDQLKVEMIEVVKANAASGINAIVDYCHNESSVKGWWTAKDGSHLKDNPLTFSNKLMLIVSEIAEAMEGDRKDSMDDHLPHRKMAEVELADAVIRIFDLAGAYGFDLGGAVVEKMEYNKTRADHSKEARGEANGKRY